MRVAPHADRERVAGSRRQPHLEPRLVDWNRLAVHGDGISVVLSIGAHLNRDGAVFHGVGVHQGQRDAVGAYTLDQRGHVFGQVLYFGLFCMTIFGLFQTQIW